MLLHVLLISHIANMHGYVCNLFEKIYSTYTCINVPGQDKMESSQFLATLSIHVYLSKTKQFALISNVNDIKIMQDIQNYKRTNIFCLSVIILLLATNVTDSVFECQNNAELFIIEIFPSCF